MDQAEEQSNFETTNEAAEALMDYLEPEVSQEEAEDLDGDQPELEDEADDLDESDDEEEQDDDEEVEEEELEESVYTLSDDDQLLIDGDQITFKELREGQLRQADYTRKTQELAEQRKQAEQEFVQQKQAIESQAQSMTVLTQQLQEMTQADQNIDWDQLMDEDPAMYIRMKEQAQQRQQALYQANQQQQLLQQQAQQEQEQRQQAHVQAQYEQLLTEWPEWKDPAIASSKKKEINIYLSNNGFTEDEIGSLADFRTLKVIDKARRYDELQSKKPAVKNRANKAPAMIKPRSGRTKADANNSAREKQLKRLRKSGSKQDAALLLQDF